MNLQLIWKAEFCFDGKCHRTLTNQMKRDIQIELSKYLINYRNVGCFVYINSIICLSSFLQRVISGQKYIILIELSYTCYEGDMCIKRQLVELEVLFS